MDHDSGYHLLFSNPILVRELLEGFVSEPWVSDIDFSSIKRINAKQHASNLERREGDIIYELHSFSGKPLYLYLFLEFQSTPDRWMALRMSVYVQLFWQHLIKERKLSGSQKLPPVFPLVLYNGSQRWGCVQSLTQLIDLPAKSSLWRFQPEMRYYLVDEQRYAQSVGDARRFSDEGLPLGSDENNSLVGLLFQLENCRSPIRMQCLVDQLIELALRPEYEGMKRDLTSWMKQVLLPGFLSKQDNTQSSLLEINNLSLSELSEVKNMLADRIKQWEVDLVEQGIEQGVEQGLKTGLKKGFKTGSVTALRETLIKLLILKFDEIPVDVAELIETFDTEKLDDCLMKVISAITLEDVIPNN